MALSGKTREGVGELESRSLDRVEIHDVLRNERRRKALSYLLGNGGETSLRELSEDIAEEETGERPPPRKTRNSVYISLHQNHLPKLDSLGIISYDDSSKAIELKEQIEHIRPYLTSNDELLPNRPLYYLGLGLAGVFTVTASAYGLPPFSFVQPIGWLVGYIFVSLVCAGFELRGVDLAPDSG